MDANFVIINLISVCIGYLIGSISPSYFFGKLKGVDIREIGTKNAGTTNTYRMLGIQYAIPTASYDTLKGLFAIYLSLVLGANLFFASMAGFAAILGHIFPFYLHFNGGQGVAAATGMMLVKREVFHKMTFLISTMYF